MTYIPAGDKKSLDKLEAAVNELTARADEGTKIVEIIAQNQEKLDNLNSELSQTKELIADLRAKLEDSVKRQNKQSSAIEDKSKELDKQRSIQANLTEQFLNAREIRDEARDAYLDSIPATTIREPIQFCSDSNGPPSGLIHLHCLGDTHGWAPGLANFIIHNKISDISINGKSISKEGCAEIFPSPTDVQRKGITIEGLYPDHSPFLHSLFGKSRGFFRDIQVDISETFLNSGMFVQVGDLNDRGDFSEVCFEIMRHLALAAPGQIVSLIGNHEEMLLSGNFAVWLNNEKSTGLFDSEEKPGSIRLLDSDGSRGLSEEDISKIESGIFHSYSAHYAQMLLAQELAIRSILDSESLQRYRKVTQPALDLANIDDTELERISRSRDWVDVERSLDWFELLRSKKGEGLSVPGCFNVFSVGHFCGLHASISSLGNLVKDSAFLPFSEGFRTKSGATLRIHHYRMGQNSKKSLDNERLWSRDGRSWGTGKPTSEMQSSVETVLEKIPYLRTFTQGHEVMGTKDLKIGLSKFNSTPTIEIELYNVDVGMTPVYLPHDLEDLYSMSRVPDGLKIETLGIIPETWGHNWFLPKPFVATRGLQGTVEKGGSSPNLASILMVSREDSTPAKIGEIQKIGPRKYRIQLHKADLFIAVKKGRKISHLSEFQFDLGDAVYIWQRSKGGLFRTTRYQHILTIQGENSADEDNEHKEISEVLKQIEAKEEERKRKEEEERKRKEEEERKRKEEEERKRKEEEERKRNEDQASKQLADSKQLESQHQNMDSDFVEKKDAEKMLIPASLTTKIKRTVVIDGTNIARSTPDGSPDGNRLLEAVRWFIRNDHVVHIYLIERYFSNPKTKDEWFPHTEFLRRDTLDGSQNLKFHFVPQGSDDDLSALYLAKAHGAFLLSLDNFRQNKYKNKGFDDYRKRDAKLRLEPVKARGNSEFELTAESLEKYVKECLIDV